MVTAAVLGLLEVRRWTDLASAEDVDGAVYVEAHDVFVVEAGGSFLVFSGGTPHVDGESLFYCPTGYFIGAHGEYFDARGRYIGGPARGGLDRYPVRIEEGFVAANLNERISAERTPSGEFPPVRRCREPWGSGRPSGILPMP